MYLHSFLQRRVFKFVVCDLVVDVAQLVVREEDAVLAFGFYEDLARLDVPVHHAVRVEVVEGLEEAEGELRGQNELDFLTGPNAQLVLDAPRLVVRLDKDEPRALDKDALVADDILVAGVPEPIRQLAVVFPLLDGWQTGALASPVLLVFFGVVHLQHNSAFAFLRYCLLKKGVCTIILKIFNKIGY